MGIVATFMVGVQNWAPKAHGQPAGMSRAYHAAPAASPGRSCGGRAGTSAAGSGTVGHHDELSRRKPEAASLPRHRHFAAPMAGGAQTGLCLR
jgi:hypothetical protein